MLRNIVSLGNTGGFAIAAHLHRDYMIAPLGQLTGIRTIVINVYFGGKYKPIAASPILVKNVNAVGGLHIGHRRLPAFLPVKPELNCIHSQTGGDQSSDDDKHAAIAIGGGQPAAQ